MKRFAGYLLVEIILLGIVSYFLAKWNQPIDSEWIDTTHNTIGFILLIFPITNAIIAYISFSRFTNKYPRNNSAEFIQRYQKKSIRTENGVKIQQKA